MYYSLQADEFSRPIERKLFERIHPTCHEFNKIAATSNRVVLIVGFSNGQIQLIEKDNKKMFNSDVSFLVSITGIYSLFNFHSSAETVILIIVKVDRDVVLLKIPRGWVASARVCDQKMFFARRNIIPIFQRTDK